MAYLMVPVSFDSLAIDGSAGISSEAFQVPYPQVLSKIFHMGGDVLLDLDFGYDADLLPAPFSVRLFFVAATATALHSLVDSLFAPPATGKVGGSGTFIAKLHGTSTNYWCTAQMQAPKKAISGRELGPNTVKLSGINVTFVPTNMFAAV